MRRTRADITFPPDTGRSQRGVTLLELATTMAIACLLLGLGLPSYLQMTQQWRADATRDLLLSHFASARLTAISHRRITAVCPSNGPDSGCRQDGDWSHGWLMFFDPDGDRQPNLPEDLLRHEAVSLPDAFRIRSSSGRPQLRYLANGMSTGSNLTVRICLQERLMTEVIVNNAGRARSRRNGGGETCPP
ncbi:GspH/FimT family pseudopilin [Pseudoxanthomonas sp. 22568]|uniref:GspH/FimT family pseudopilin n=1 Tax=Pseudoxanthomonas sp. 22568 TaxID=3453945 RepID=UPI003F85F289